MDDISAESDETRKLDCHQNPCRDEMRLEAERANIVLHGEDVTIIANGSEVQQALIAAEALEAENISAEIINVSLVESLDEQTILASVMKTGCAVVCEDHSINANLGETVARILAENHPVPCEIIDRNDVLGKSHEIEESHGNIGSDAIAIAEAAKRQLS